MSSYIAGTIGVSRLMIGLASSGGHQEVVQPLKESR